MGNKISVGDKLSPSVFTELKNQINTIVSKRKGLDTMKDVTVIKSDTRINFEAVETYNTSYSKIYPQNSNPPTDYNVKPLAAYINPLISNSELYAGLDNISVLRATVATYDNLINYPTASILTGNIIKVSSDRTHENRTSYYRWNGASWIYIGSPVDLVSEDSYNNYNMISGCNAYCTGLCTTSCSNICRTSCTGVCDNSCSGDCATQGWSGSTKTCYNCGSQCSGGCTGSSYQVCRGCCDGSCWSSCDGCADGCAQICGECSGCGACSQCSTSCTEMCGESCTSSCDQNCASGCGWSCSDTCLNSCKDSCANGCKGTCDGCSGCGGSCDGSCSRNCSGTCGSGCSTGCTGTLTQNATKIS